MYASSPKRRHILTFDVLEDRCLLNGGGLDMFFGTGGIVETPFQAPIGGGPGNIATDSAGRIIVVGQGTGAQPDSGAGIWRLQPNGALDPTFGSNGHVSFEPAGYKLGFVALAQNGDILVDATNGQTGIAVFAFNAAGNPDASFGQGGTAFIGLSSTNTKPGVGNLLVQPDGKVLVAGTFESFGGRSFVVARLTAGGTADSTFGTAGNVVLSGGEYYSSNTIALQNDQKIVVAGATASYEAIVQRLNSDGSLDLGFGQRGEIVTVYGLDPTAVVIQPDQKIVLAGMVTFGQAALIRLNGNGTLDTTFGSSGLVSDSGMVATAGLVQTPDGRLLLGGVTSSNSNAENGIPELDQISSNGTISRSSFSTLVVMQPTGLIMRPGSGVLLVGAQANVSEATTVVAFQPSLTPDPAFGNAASLSLSSLGAVTASASQTLVQKDGKLVVVGAAGNTLALARYDNAGFLDPTFGQGGQVVTPVTNYVLRATPEFGQTASATLESDGKILAAITVDLIGGAQAALVARYNPDGSLDGTFGSGGEAQIALPILGSAVDGIIEQSDQKILLAAGGPAGFGPGSFSLSRLEPNGAADNSFGNGGTAVASLPMSNSAFVTGIALQADSKILIAGVSFSSQSDIVYIGFVLRFTASGSLDPSWGQNGVVSTSFDAGGGADLAVLPNGDVLVGGTGLNRAGNLALMRLTSNGSLDTSFGTGGVAQAVFAPGQSYAQALVVQADGSIVVAGETTIGTQTGLAMARFSPGGSLDSSFGVGGKVTTALPLPPTSNGLALDLHGNLVVAGSVNYAPTGSSSFLIARYNGQTVALPPNDVFVEQAFGFLLNRAADQSGLASFAGLLNQGMGRAGVVQVIEGSQEYRTDEVENLYETHLGRQADSAGLAGFLSFLSGGGSISDVERIILGSPEYYARAGSTVSGFLTALYHDVLNRVPDPQGEQAFSSILMQGVSRDVVAFDVLHSLEARQDLVEGYYQTYLLRAADPSGMAAFTSFGMQNDTIVALILGSEEYFDRFVLPQS